MEIQISGAVREILRRLESEGHEAYAVGGCVRDSLRGVLPHDWDIATSATPEQVIACFAGERLIPTGIRYGTLTLLWEGDRYEITTFRVDEGYTDSRRPDSITYARHLSDDLARRDFTINALAADRSGRVRDYFGGSEDLKNRIVRCVGDPRQRFEEDALRILRCVRFASVLGFRMEGETARAMLALCPTVDRVARERVREELCGALMGDAFETVFLRYPEVLVQIIPELAPGIGFDQRTPYHHLTIWEHTLRAVQLSEKNVTVRLALLLHDVGKPDCYTVDANGVGHFHGHDRVGARIAEAVLTRLRFSREQVEAVVALVHRHSVAIEPEERSVRRWLNRLGEQQLRRLLMVKRADTLAHAPEHQDDRLGAVREVGEVLERVVRSRQCFSLRDLAVDGSDLLSIGVPEGKRVGELLRHLLDRVIEGEIENQKEPLLDCASKHRDEVER